MREDTRAHAVMPFVVNERDVACTQRRGAWYREISAASWPRDLVGLEHTRSAGDECAGFARIRSSG
jgi:hypothetical protein